MWQTHFSLSLSVFVWPLWLFLFEAMAFEQLTRRHGIKVPVGVDCSIEECSLTVGEVVGHSCIKLASRMNSAIVLFLETIEKVTYWSFSAGQSGKKSGDFKCSPTHQR